MSSRDEEAVQLSESDVRAMVRLIGGVAAIENDQALQRRKLMENLGEMVNADCWLWSMFRLCEPDGGAMTIGLMHGGLGEKEIAKVAAAETDPKLMKPETPALLELLTTEKHFTRRRVQMVDDADWYDHPHTSVYRQDWLDDCIYSIFPVNTQEQIYSGIGLHRKWGNDPFTAREARIVHIITSEVPWLHDAAVPGTNGEGTQRLAPRLRPVLTLLMDGQSRKRIAHNLGLSVHTIGDYIKAIYRHFNVSGRAQLMRHFMAGDGGDRNVTAD